MIFSIIFQSKFVFSVTPAEYISETASIALGQLKHVDLRTHDDESSEQSRASAKEKWSKKSKFLLF